MLSIIGSELTKIVTLRSVWLVTGVLLALNVLVLHVQQDTYIAAVTSISPEGMIEVIPGQPEPAESLIWDLAAWPLQVGIFTFVIGAVIAGSEFRVGQLGTSVLAVPSRVRLMCAKTAATALIALAFGVVLTMTAMAYMYAVVKDWNVALLWNTATLLGYARFLFFIVAFTLVGFALTIMARRTLIGVLACGLLLGLTMTQVVAAIAPSLDAVLPVSAARNLLIRPGIAPPLTASAEHGTLVLVGWAVITLAGATWALRRRDAR